MDDKKDQLLRKEALDYHEEAPQGKIKVVPTKPHSTAHELSLAYSPGVAYPCLEIASTFSALETIGWWSSEKTGPTLPRRRAKRTAIFSRSASRIALTCFHDPKQTCSHGADLLKVHQHGFNLAQQSNPASPPFRWG